METKEKQLEERISKLREQIEELEEEADILDDELYALRSVERKDKLRNKLKNFDPAHTTDFLFYEKNPIAYHNDPIIIYEVLSFDKEICAGEYKTTYIHMYDSEYMTVIKVEKFGENDLSFVDSKILPWTRYCEYLNILLEPSLSIKELSKELDRIDKQYV